ncbi:MAG: hypothetical protein V1731_02970 [Candidatus Aenigmatarchaeota archaeon]
MSRVVFTYQPRTSIDGVPSFANSLGAGVTKSLEESGVNYRMRMKISGYKANNPKVSLVISVAEGQERRLGSVLSDNFARFGAPESVGSDQKGYESWADKSLKALGKKLSPKDRKSEYEKGLRERVVEPAVQ